MQSRLRHSAGVGGILGASNSNIYDEMKAYTKTLDLGAGVETTDTTTIASTRAIYSIEYIDSGGVVITTGLGTPTIATAGGFYTITVYSTDALTDTVLRVIYK